MTNERIDALLKPLVREASLLAPTKSKTAHAATTESKFGGIPYAESGDSWPQCTKCNNDLVFVAQLHDKNRRELFVFFYCFECFPWGLPDEVHGQWCIRRYLAPSKEQLRELSPPEGQSYAIDACSVSEEKTRALPDWEGINSHNKEIADLCVAISDSPWEEYYAAVQRLNCLDDYVTLIDGYPRHVQSAPVGSRAG